MNPLFVVGIAGLAALVYFCYENTVTSGAQKPAPLKVNVKQYADVDSEWSNPMNLTTNPRVVKEIFREPGPFGVDRVVYEGAGESWNAIYSTNYEAL